MLALFNKSVEHFSISASCTKQLSSLAWSAFGFFMLHNMQLLDSCGQLLVKSPGCSHVIDKRVFYLGQILKCSKLSIKLVNA